MSGTEKLTEQEIIERLTTCTNAEELNNVFRYARESGFSVGRVYKMYLASEVSATLDNIIIYKLPDSTLGNPSGNWRVLGIIAEQKAAPKPSRTEPRDVIELPARIRSRVRNALGMLKGSN